MAIGLEAQCAAHACCPVSLKNHGHSVLHHRKIRLRRSVRCGALHGIQMEQIKSWFQNRFEERKRLIALDEGEISSVTNEENEEGVEFDLDLAVVLAGFAFEAYNSPSENAGTRESDGYKCETTYLSEALIRELYQGQLTVKLEKARNLPGLDLWGTSDPYVWLRVGDCAKQSKTVWATKDPVWDETLVLNVSDPFEQSLEVAVWDANVLSVHRRLGNYEVGLKDLCDGNTHELSMQLEGMGGGGTIFLKASYKTFDEIEKEKKKWEVPFLSDLVKGGLGGVLASIFGTEGIKVQDFVGSTVGSLQFFNGAAQTAPALLKNEEPPHESSGESLSIYGGLIGLTDALKRYLGGFEVKGVQIPLFNFKSDEQHTLEQSGWDFQARAAAKYIEKGLAHPSDEDSEAFPQSSERSAIMPLPDVKTTLLNISGHMEELLGSWLMVATPILRQQTERKSLECTEGMQESLSVLNESPLGTSEREQMREMFKRAETAMEAWTILASALGRTSFVKSEFEKICFLESKNTDTQLSVWRDCRGQRLVVAFRGTEQTKWRDLATDLMLVPTGFNPERIADGDLSDEILVHTGFLTAYDSIRHRLLSIIKASVRNRKVNDDSTLAKWHIYMTGHSLGGALATLLAMDLSQTQMFKRQEVGLSMYNFGSPRVGNKAFADHYNKVIKDSWRIVNHRDIIPTVPRLMGYCHVAHPIYLASLEDSDLLDDVIGEATPVGIVGEFLKGEKQLINKLLQTEISMLRALRDGTALMQHMEDFYYISLLERVSLRHKTKQLSA